MADNSLSVDESMKYHPADSPRGTLFYNLEDLTDDQQVKLNALKIDTVRENEKYLAAHPQIRAIIILILRVLLRRRPMLKVHEFIAKFFNRSEAAIAKDVEKYLETRKDHVYEDKSAIELLKSLTKKSFSEEVSEESTPDRPSDFECSEECVCEHNLDWKLQYKAHDDRSFTETEHWITPRTTKTSITLDDSRHGGTTDEYFSLTELARLMEAEEEEGDETENGDKKGHTVFDEDKDEYKDLDGQNSSGDIAEEEPLENPDEE